MVRSNRFCPRPNISKYLAGGLMSESSRDLLSWLLASLCSKEVM